MWSPTKAAGAPPSQGPPTWQRTDSRHFEIHYVRARADELERVTRSAERAYDQISSRLSFTLSTKVPLVLFAPSDTPSREDVVAYAISDEVAPQYPHRSRIVLPIPEGDGQLDALVALLE